MLETRPRQDSLNVSDWLLLQAVVKLPFANVKRLAAAAQQADPDEQELSTEDEVCNALSLVITAILKLRGRLHGACNFCQRIQT